VTTAGAEQRRAPAPTARGRFDWRDLLEGSVLVAAALVVWGAASALPPAPIEGEMSSSVWPKALAAALGFFGLALIVEALRGRVKRDESLEPVNTAQWPTFAVTLVIIVAFLIAWPAVGFLPTAVVSFVLLCRVLGVGGWLRSAAWGIGLALLLWVIFDQLLSIPI
jgi:hypothetical protein